MYDFCFTIPYGILIVVGGIVGYLKKRSLASLGGGAGAGLLLILAGYLSLKAFEKRKNSYFALILETGKFDKAFASRCSLALLSTGSVLSSV